MKYCGGVRVYTQEVTYMCLLAEGRKEHRGSRDGVARS